MVYSRNNSPPPPKRQRREPEYREQSSTQTQPQEGGHYDQHDGYGRPPSVRIEYQMKGEERDYPPVSSLPPSSLSLGTGDSPSIPGAGQQSPTSSAYPSYTHPLPPLPPPPQGYHYQQPRRPSPAPQPIPQFSSSREYRPPQQQYPVFPPHPPPHPQGQASHGSSMNGNPGPSSASSSSSSIMQQQQHTTSGSHNHNHYHASDALPPLSLSILGVEPLDEFIKEIADFVHHMIVTRPEHLGGAVEVEAKIGVLREKRSNARLGLPVLVESILAPDVLDVRFESNMSASQHRHYNGLLNNLKTESSTSTNHPSTPLDYSHLFLVDNFYASDPIMHEGQRLRGSDKIRVTRDEKAKTVVQCVKKVRLGDLNIYSPKRAADWRISVNLEIPVQHPLGSPTHTRRKDRMCYSHEEFVIDLTQVVSQQSPGAPTQTLHELELEIARPELLLATAAKRNDVSYSEHERSAFDELIRAFVNNARILVRNSPGFD